MHRLPPKSDTLDRVMYSTVYFSQGSLFGGLGMEPYTSLLPWLLMERRSSSRRYLWGPKAFLVAIIYLLWALRGRLAVQSVPWGKRGFEFAEHAWNRYSRSCSCCNEISNTCILLLFERAGRLIFKDQFYPFNIRRAMGLDRSTSSRCSVVQFL